VNSTGTVRLGDRDLRGLPAYQRARDGLTRTWQSTELFDDLSVFENLTVAARESGATEDDAKRVLSLVGMDWAAEAEPSALSSGQRKLVGVARALVAKPKLICLDEPAAGLDTAESEELGATLRRLADQGQSMLLIEHDMGLVRGICRLPGRRHGADRRGPDGGTRDGLNRKPGSSRTTAAGCPRYSIRVAEARVPGHLSRHARSASRPRVRHLSACVQPNFDALAIGNDDPLMRLICAMQCH
jgi:hypothetical protein